MIESESFVCAMWLGGIKNNVYLLQKIEHEVLFAWYSSRSKNNAYLLQEVRGKAFESISQKMSPGGEIVR